MKWSPSLWCAHISGPYNSPLSRTASDYSRLKWQGTHKAVFGVEISVSFCRARFGNSFELLSKRCGREYSSRNSPSYSPFRYHQLHSLPLKFATPSPQIFAPCIHLVNHVMTHTTSSAATLLPKESFSARRLFYVINNKHFVHHDCGIWWFLLLRKYFAMIRRLNHM